MQAIVDPVYFKRTERISPGVVGSVGDALGGVRLKQSAPDMPMRYEAAFAGVNTPITGSNVQDGFSYSYSSGGGPARTLESGWANRGFKTNHGWRYQDLRAPDTTLETLTLPTERYSWYNKIATIYEAKRTGDLFLPLPGPYEPTSLTRGTQYPVVTERMAPTNEFKTTPGTQKDKPKEILGTGTDSKSIIGYNCTDERGNVTFKTVEQMRQQANVPSVVQTRQPEPFTFTPAPGAPQDRPLTEEEERQLRLLNKGGFAG